MSRMSLCLSMWSLQELVTAGRMDLSGFLDYCLDNGVAEVELLEFMQEESPAETRAMLASRGIRAGAWSAANNFVQPDSAALREQVDGMKRSIDGAAELGAPILRVFSGDEHPDAKYEDGLKRILEGFAACEPYAREARVVMALENHGVFAGRSAQVNHIISSIASPWLRATLDTANFLFVDEEPLAAARNLATSAAWVHAKDYAPCAPDAEGAWPSLAGRYYEGCALGDGSVDLPGIVRALGAAGYTGGLSIEYEGPNPLFNTKRSIAFLKSILNSPGEV